MATDPGREREAIESAVEARARAGRTGIMVWSLLGAAVAVAIAVLIVAYAI